MRLVCSYCHKVIRHDAGTRVLDVSHGMCASCAAHFSKLWNGGPLADYLDALPEPAVIVDPEGRVIGANAPLATLVARDRTELPGLLCGEAFDCVNARSIEGCGKRARCRECAVRRTVTSVHESGAPLRDVAAMLETFGGRLALRISASAEQGLVKVIVSEARALPE